MGDSGHAASGCVSACLLQPVANNESDLCFFLIPFLSSFHMQFSPTFSCCSAEHMKQRGSSSCRHEIACASSPDGILRLSESCVNTPHSLFCTSGRSSDASGWLSDSKHTSLSLLLKRPYITFTPKFSKHFLGGTGHITLMMIKRANMHHSCWNNQQIETVQTCDHQDRELLALPF